MITVTENAKNKIEELLASDSRIDSSYFLRVGVKGAGCAGLSYKMDFDNTHLEGDEIFEDKGVIIICDKKSLLYLWGTELDYSGGLNGKGFTWNNPQSSRVCGCGSSFSI